MLVRAPDRKVAKLNHDNLFSMPIDSSYSARGRASGALSDLRVTVGLAIIISLS